MNMFSGISSGQSEVVPPHARLVRRKLGTFGPRTAGFFIVTFSIILGAAAILKLMTIRNVFLDSNLVFPVLSDKQLTIVAIAVDTAAAILMLLLIRKPNFCFWVAGVLGAVYLWYHFSVYYLGGKGCACLGAYNTKRTGTGGLLSAIYLFVCGISYLLLGHLKKRENGSILHENTVS
jgi:hypothetical protein